MAARARRCGRVREGGAAIPGVRAGRAGRSTASRGPQRGAEHRRRRGTEGTREYRRFLDVARASLQEVEAILDIAGDLSYLDPVTLTRLRERRDEAARTLFGLLRSLSKAPEK
jgi:four helix bundle protein